jgi:broad specificity phosphatase PhoE
LLSGTPAAVVDPRLVEIAYGDCDGLSVAAARERHPELFAAWQRGEDPCFPGGGENSAAVLARIQNFAREQWRPDGPPTLVCTHNVVLRCLVGRLLGVPMTDWHRLHIPHLAPIHLVASRFGLFVDLDEAVERQVFAGFFHPTKD